MTYEEFSLFVDYENRREQFPRHLSPHSALFQVMCRYVDRDNMSISLKESGKRSKYIVKCDEGDLYGLAAILSKTDAYLNGNVVKPKFKMLNATVMELYF